MVKLIKLVLACAVVAVIGVGVIYADDDTSVPTFSDGRVNNWEIDAPLAVFCVFDETDDGGVFQRVEVWGLDSLKLLEASAAEINAAQGAQVLASADGYTLAALSSGSFEVSAPNGYTFDWQRGDTNC